MQITYNKGQISELEEIYDLVQAAIETMNNHDILQWDSLYPNQEDFANDLRKQELYVGRVEGQLAVIYVLNQEEDEQYKNGSWSDKTNSFRVLHRLCVHPNFQNCGIGARVLQHIHEELSKEGIHTIRLDAFSQNPYARRMYEKAGYEQVGTVQFRKGVFYLMEKVL